MGILEIMVTTAAFAANESQDLSQKVETGLKSFFPPDSLVPFLIAHFGLPVTALGLSMLTRRLLRRMENVELHGLISEHSSNLPVDRQIKTASIAVLREKAEPNIQISMKKIPVSGYKDYLRPKVAERKRSWRRQEKLGRH